MRNKNVSLGLCVLGASVSLACSGDPVVTPLEVNLGSEVHVDASAAGQGNGTENRPFTSLKAALAVIAEDADWKGTIVMHPGKHEITEETVLPKNAVWKILPKTTIAVAPDVSIHAQNDVEARGTEAEPIVFTWLETGKHWNSLTNFTKGSDKNVFEYVTFEHGYESNYQGIGMRGALSLRDAKALISHCVFRENEGDDGLNIKASSSIIEYSTFEDNKSDAIDSDGVGEPIIRYSLFQNQVNDNLDLGEGTRAHVHHNKLVNGLDKGISIGDGAEPLVEHNIIVNNYLGIGIKDDANPTIRNNTLYDNEVGIRMYHHVDTFGNAHGTVYNNIIWGSKIQDILYELGDTVFKYNCVSSLEDTEGNPVVDNEGNLLSENEGMIYPGAGCDDPGFADPDNLDFHLKSAAGRWDPESEEWVNDEETSPAIDAGDPSMESGDEPTPNGNRINLGAHGGTEEASKSP